jgi:hypothetical protein
MCRKGVIWFLRDKLHLNHIKNAEQLFARHF